jgi:tetratricopeptide (TPR) repeat protein
MWNKSAILAVMILTGGVLLGSARAAAQGSQDAPPTLNQDKKQPAKPSDVSPLTLDAAPPVNAEEDAAMKAFRDLPMSDVDKKNQAGEAFLQKYPQSRYRGEVYGWLVRGYWSQGQVDKLEVAGDKAIELNPSDAQTMAILGSTLPRAMNASTPNPQQRLDKAEQYSKKALELLPTLPKPPEISDENFLKAKDQTSALAYSGLGLVAFRRKKFAEAIPDFEQAVKLDPTPDPVNFYLLGVSDQQTAHFDDAVAAFAKCAAIPGGMQGTCKSSAEEAKKLGATQLNAPK